MKKIILLLNHSFPYSGLDFAVHIAKNQKCKVLVIITGALQMKDDNEYGFISDIKATETDYTASTDEEEELTKELDELKFVKDVFDNNRVEFSVKTVREDIAETLIKESIYADVVICRKDMEGDTFNVNDFISSAHCPVVLMPEEAEIFTNMVFSYDGQISSVHAMKQFAYLFSWMQPRKVTLISVLPVNILQMEHDALIREWIVLHFPKAEIVVLKGDIRSELVTFVNNISESLVVMGSFGRNAFSMFFKESLGITVLRKTNASVFICHT